jgi:hypothetical protein
MTKYADTNENWIDNLNTRTLNLDNSTEKNTFTLRVRGGDSENSEKKSTDPVGLCNVLVQNLYTLLQ